MRCVLGLLIAAGLVVAIAWWVVSLPGKVALSIAGLDIETSTSVALLLGAIALLALYILVRLIVLVLSWPRRIGRWRSQGRRAKGDAAVTRALVTLAATEGRAARSAAAKARRLLGDTPQTLLLAAEAARQDGDEAGAATIYELMAKRPDAAFLGLRGLFRQAMSKGDWSEAQRLSRDAQAIQPGAAWLRQARLELAARTGDWLPVLSLAGPDAPLAALAAAASDTATSAVEGERLARRAFHADPGFVPAALAYAKRLREAGREGRTLEVLREAWTNAPHPALAELALQTQDDAASRLQAGAGLVRQRAEHPESHLLLGRLSLQAGAFAEARRHARAAIASGLTDQRAWLLLADAEQAEGGDPHAVRDALRQATEAQPAPAWHCGVCHTDHADWHAACPNCHSPSSLAWGHPPRRAPLIAHAPPPALLG
jgi:HemY protein